MATNSSEWRRFLLTLADELCRVREAVEDRVRDHGSRVGELAVSLAHAATEAGVAGASELSDRERAAMRLAASLHALADAAPADGEPPGRLAPEAMAAIEYRLRWIREICRRRAISRSVFDGGGFYPPADPSGLGAMDYALRATDVESVIEFVGRMNLTGPRTERDREWLGELARRHLETGEGPSVPYLTEEEHAALAEPDHGRRDARREGLRWRLDALLEGLRRVAWTDELRDVPELVESLIVGAGRRSSLAARILVVAERSERLLHRDAPDGAPAGPDQVMMQLRREAEAGRLDREVVSALAQGDLLRGRDRRGGGGERGAETTRAGIH